MKIPDYITIMDCKYLKPFDWSKHVLPAGTFVKPLEPTYLPAHIKAGIDYETFRPETEIFVYCSVGIIVIPKHAIRSV
jgi:hypothetical protein